MSKLAIYDGSREQRNMSHEATQMWKQYQDGKPITFPVTTHFLPEYLRELADKIECEQLAGWLKNLGVNADCKDWESRGIVPIWVGITVGETSVCVNAHFARRVIDRIRSGLSADVALQRTIDQTQPGRTPEQQARYAEELDRETRRIEREKQRGE